MDTGPRVSELLAACADRLGLRWVGEPLGVARTLGPRGSEPSVGRLDVVHPHRVQVLGSAELELLEGLAAPERGLTIDRLVAPPPALVVVGDGHDVPGALAAACREAGIALMACALPTASLVARLTRDLARLLAERITVHGVFMDVIGIGVLLTGESGIGKSELALELVSRGHRLVADDAPTFCRAEGGTLEGFGPAGMNEFLEVRGLGLLNLRAIFGDGAVKGRKRLGLIVRLSRFHQVEDASAPSRLEGSYSERRYLDVEVPELSLAVAPGRPLAVLVEAAARDHILRRRGYNAGVEFARIQRARMEQTS